MRSTHRLITIIAILISLSLGCGDSSMEMISSSESRSTSSSEGRVEEVPCERCNALQLQWAEILLDIANSAVQSSGVTNITVSAVSDAYVEAVNSVEIAETEEEMDSIVNTFEETVERIIEDEESSQV